MVDTSIWIEYFRRGADPIRADVNSLIDQDRIVLCGVVEMELLRGLRSHEAGRIKEAFRAFRFVETLREDFVSAGERMGALRRKGVTIPSSDALIGAICVREGLALLTLDDHFKHLPEVKRLAPGRANR
ncbi:MAG: PIN domain-containing protein [Candidatus Sumerlaeota bacterium]|nr:PIN domain-containing protein [Candidatus Sumerlaeota bacterium]